MSRIYMAIITIQPDDGSKEVSETRLVKADTPAQARNFVNRDSLGIVHASQDDLVRLVGAGYKVEDATDPRAQQPTLPEV